MMPMTLFCTFPVKVPIFSENNCNFTAAGHRKVSNMATYTITLNERTASGKALRSYLQALGVLVQKVTPAKKSSYERSQDDIREGRVEKFASADDMFKSLGI